jgi:hypothetical protein
MKTVWKFTNQRELTVPEFADYFQKKVKKTVGKYKMPTSPLGGGGLKVKVINSVLKNLPPRKGKLSDQSLDDVSISILNEMMYGKFEIEKFVPHNQPLYFLSDKEVELYAKIKKIKGGIKQKTGKRKQINDFIKKIEEKNPDIRHNIINSVLNHEI